MVGSFTSQKQKSEFLYREMLKRAINAWPNDTTFFNLLIEKNNARAVGAIFLLENVFRKNGKLVSTILKTRHELDSKSQLIGRVRSGVCVDNFQNKISE